jgi:hypothetical protein
VCSSDLKEIDDNANSLGFNIIDRRYDRTLIFFDPSNSIIVRIEASMGYDASIVDAIDNEGVFFNRIKLKIKGETQKLNFLKSELEKLIIAACN